MAEWNANQEQCQLFSLSLSVLSSRVNSLAAYHCVSACSELRLRGERGGIRLTTVRHQNMWPWPACRHVHVVAAVTDCSTDNLRQAQL